MKLVTKEIERKLPPLGTNDSDDIVKSLQAPVVVKFFTPDSGWTWYVTEGNLETGELFGLCCGFDSELGYVSFDELKDLRGPMGLPVERDLHWEGTLADAIIYEAGRGRPNALLADAERAKGVQS